MNEAEYLLSNNLTIRSGAKDLGISKSVLHRHMSKELKYINYELYLKINNMFLEHNKNRHINGGIATKNKYKKS